LLTKRVALKFALLVAIIGAGLSSAALARVESAQTPPAATPPPGRAITTPSPSGWIILPKLPATAPQADTGAEIWRLVCQDCHGNRGQGLTAEWRAQWAPADQNCWQSKCHAANHPPEGFVLPRSVPALVGPKALDQLSTALALHDYICTLMPWYNPGCLEDIQCWELTAFLVRKNGIKLPNSPLDRASAARLLLHPPAALPTPRP
jgi:hypothetical protein